MRILVLWANEAQPNLGVSALGAGARTLALRAFPDAEISFHSTGGTDLPGNDGPIIITVPKSLFAGFLLNRRGFRTWLRSFDLILDTRAGDSFASIYGMKRLVTMSILPLMARILRVPIVLMPQTIGPFESVTARGIARVVMRSASAVMVRDVGSVRAAEELGVEPDALATDVVFSLPRPERRPEHDVLLNVSGLLLSLIHISEPTRLL